MPDPLATIGAGHRRAGAIPAIPGLDVAWHSGSWGLGGAGEERLARARSARADRGQRTTVAGRCRKTCGGMGRVSWGSSNRHLAPKSSTSALDYGVIPENYGRPATLKLGLAGVPYHCGAWPLRAEGDGQVRTVTLPTAKRPGRRRATPLPAASAWCQTSSCRWPLDAR